MNSLCIAIRKGPYGVLSAAEGVRHLIGAVQAGMPACAVLVDDGVYLAKQGQNPGGTAWMSLSAALEQALGPRTGSSPRTRLYVHRLSAETRGLGPSDLVAGVEMVDDAQLAAALASADALLIF